MRESDMINSTDEFDSDEEYESYLEAVGDALSLLAVINLDDGGKMVESILCSVTSKGTPYVQLVLSSLNEIAQEGAGTDDTKAATELVNSLTFAKQELELLTT